MCRALFDDTFLFYTGSGYIARMRVLGEVRHLADVFIANLYFCRGCGQVESCK